MAIARVLTSIPSVSSSIMLYEKELSVLLDCGDGALINILEDSMPFPEAVIISHDHADHSAGLFSLLTFSVITGRKINTYFPSGSEYVNRVIGELNRRYRESSLGFIPMEPEEDYSAGHLQIKTHTAVHGSSHYHLPSLCYEISIFERRIFYTGDTAYFDELAVYSKEKDLVISEATIEVIEGSDPSAYDIHMDLKQAESIKPENGELLIVHRGGLNGESGRKEIQL